MRQSHFELVLQGNLSPRILSPRERETIIALFAVVCGGSEIPALVLAEKVVC
jgi:hypothetical protein